MYRQAVARLIAEICDTHAFSDFVPVFGNRVVDISMAFVEETLIATSPFLPSPTEFEIQPGDEIVSIGGRSVADIKSRVAEYFSLSNSGGLLRQTATYAGTTNDPTTTISYWSNGTFKSEVFPTRMWRIEPSLMAVQTRAFSVPFCLVEEGTIGYMNAGYYVASEVANMMNTLRDTKGIIIDMRIYPSDNMFSLTHGYITNIAQDFIKFGQADGLTPGILFDGYLSTRYTSNYQVYPGKVIVIVNERTQSNGEFVTMQLQTIPGVVTIGSLTAGADGNVSHFDLPGGIRTTISGLGVYYPDGTETQRVGIRVDIEVKPTIAGIKEGRDELYEKAVALILNN